DADEFCQGIRCQRQCALLRGASLEMKCFPWRFGADVLEQLRIRREPHLRLDRHWLVQRSGIDDRDLTPHVSEVDTAIALDHAQGLRVRMAAEIQPGAVLKAVA